MNRFVKQNLLMFTVMGISAVIILVLLVYSAIIYFQINQCIEETENLRKKNDSLNNIKPFPVSIPQEDRL